jgi:hypothetical protein
MLENVAQHQGNLKKCLSSAIITLGGNNNNKWLCNTKKCHGTPKLSKFEPKKLIFGKKKNLHYH